ILERLASFLVWSRAANSPGDEADANAPRSSSGDGPSAFLVLAHLTFLLIYFTLNWPFLMPPPWPSTYVVENSPPWQWAANAGLTIAVVSVVISLVSWFLLAIEKRSIKRMVLMTVGIAITTGLLLHFMIPRPAVDNVTAFLALERIVTV